MYDDPAYAEVLAGMQKELVRIRQQYKDDGSVVEFDAVRAREVKLQQVLGLNFDDGRLPSNVEAIEGPRSKAIRLYGKGAVWNQPSSEVLNPASKPLAVGAWCRVDKPGGVLIAQGGESQGFSLYLQNHVPVFAIRSEGVLKQVRGTRVEPGQWTHIAAILNANGQAQIFINGKPAGKRRKLGFVSARPADGLSVGEDSGSLVGKYESSQPFTGGLDDVRLYWGPLSAAQLSAWAE